MNNLSYGKYLGSIEFSLEDKCLFGRILFINDSILYEGQTIEGLEIAFKEAVDDYLAYCKEAGRPADKPFSGSFNVRIDKDLHRKAAQEAGKQGIALNEFVSQAIKEKIKHDGVLRVEHTHNHTIKVTGDGLLTKTFSGATDQPVEWESSGAIH